MAIVMVSGHSKKDMCQLNNCKLNNCKLNNSQLNN